MKKLMALMLMMLLLSASCSKSGGSSSDESTAIQTATSDENDSIGSTPGSVVVPPSSNSTIPALALSFQTNVDLMNFSATQENKYNEAIAIVKKVVATEKFRNTILKYSYNGTGMFSTTSKSNSQVYQSILDAAEKLTPSKNNTMDLGVKLYYEDNTVIGYTNGSITYINVNTKFFNQFSANEVAGNLMHEWLHKLGYDHDFDVTARRPYSVPYAVGYLIRDIGKSFL